MNHAHNINKKEIVQINIRFIHDHQLLDGHSTSIY